MLQSVLTFLDLAEPDKLKRAVAVAAGGFVSTVIVFVTPVLAKYGIPVPTPEMQMFLVGAITTKVTAFVLQSGARAKAADLAAIGAVPAPAGVQNPADVKP